MVVDGIYAYLVLVSYSMLRGGHNIRDFPGLCLHNLADDASFYSATSGSKTIVELDHLFQVSYDIKTEDPVNSKILTDIASKASTSKRPGTINRSGKKQAAHRGHTTYETQELESDTFRQLHSKNMQPVLYEL